MTSNQGNEYTVIDSLRGALQRVDPNLLDRCDAVLSSKNECNSNQSALRHSSSGEEGSNNNKIGADKISADDLDVPLGPLSPAKMN